MIREYFSSLTWPVKAVLLVSLAGVLVAGSLTVYSRRKLNEATEKMKEADRYRVIAIESEKQAFALKEYADKIAGDLTKANAKLAKLQAAVDKIQVPPKPGPAPEQKQQLIADLKAMGLELVMKPSTTIAPSLAGITEGDGRAIWGWGKESLRVPFLEQKVEAQANLVVGLEKAKGLAEKLAESRTQQANAYQKASESSREEANNLRIVVKDTQSALAAEKKKRLLYVAGAFVGGYAVHKATK